MKNGARWCAAIAVVAIALGISTASAAPTAAKRWYWTQSRAETLVLAKVRLPGCRVSPDPTNCSASGAPLPGRHPIGFTLGEVRCSGAGELGVSFKYSRFSCEVVSSYPPYFTAEIAVYVTGPNTFRWAII